MDAFSTILAALRAAPIRAPGPVGVACSGGRDSTVLLEAAAEALASAGSTLRAVHVAHELRGPESTLDARFVRSEARRLGIPASVYRAPVEPGPGLEARARDARYAAYRRAARGHGLTTLLLGHHEDDQLETVLMRLDRDAGPRGLSGIPRVRSLTEDCDIVRPLLEVPSRVIDLAGRGRGLTWREDASNSDLRFTRNRLRHTVVPRLDAEDVHRVAAAATRARDALDEARAIFRPRVVTQAGGAVIGFDRDALRDLPEPLVFSLIDAELQGGLSKAAWRLLSRIIDGPTRRVTLPGGQDATLVDRTVWLSTRRAPNTDTALALRHGEAIAWHPTGHRLSASQLRTGRPTLTRARTRSDLACLGADRVDGPLTVRVARPGDRMRPVGAPGRRSVRDLLSSAKVPTPLRAFWPILHDDTGPLWFPGGPTAERAAWSRGAAVRVHAKPSSARS